MGHAPAHDAAQPRVDGPGVRVAAMGLHGLGQQHHAQVGREHHGDEPGCNQRNAHHPEDAARIFTTDRPCKAHRHEARHRDQRAGQHREGCRGVGKGGGAHAVPSLLDLHHHHLHGDDGVVHQQAQGDDQRAQGDAVQVPAHDEHDGGHQGQHQRHRRRNHDARSPAQRQEAHRQHDGQGFQEGPLELPHRLIDDPGLVGHLVNHHAQRQGGLERCHALVQRRPQLQDVAAALEAQAEHQHRLAVVAHGELGWVFQAAVQPGPRRPA